MSRTRRQFLGAVGGAGTLAVAGRSVDGVQASNSGPVPAVQELQWDEPTTLTATDGEANDNFGGAVSLSADGRTAVVGTPGADSVRGAAYVYTWDSTWSQQTKLTADDREENDNLGHSVAVSADGSVALVGAENDDDPNGVSSGSAYVFSRTDGSWSQDAKLFADDGESAERFGWSVALSADGSTAAIGCKDDAIDGEFNTGSVYIFEASGGSWSQAQKLTADDGSGGAVFGSSVAMDDSGSVLLIGATAADEPNGSRAGAAYLFTQDGGAWSQGTKLAADDGDENDGFGEAVALSNDAATALVGAPGDEDANGKKAGSAYVFTQDGDDWSQGAKLAADSGEEFDAFGTAVALSGDGTTALLGADRDRVTNLTMDQDDQPERKPGSAYAFTLDSGSWAQQRTLSSPETESEDYFGGSVTLSDSGEAALVGARNGKNADGVKTGVAYATSNPSSPTPTPTPTQTETTGTDQEATTTPGQTDPTGDDSEDDSGGLPLPLLLGGAVLAAGVGWKLLSGDDDDDSSSQRGERQ
jgi:hypothetical protein